MTFWWCWTATGSPPCGPCRSSSDVGTGRFGTAPASGNRCWIGSRPGPARSVHCDSARRNGTAHPGCIHRSYRRGRPGLSGNPP